eukprot:m51a1_g8635 hypothetical protein (268) ;mRNA; f:146337-147238
MSALRLALLGVALAPLALAAINPRPSLRVVQLWGVEEPASAAFSAAEVAVILLCSLRFASAARRLPGAWRAWPFRTAWYTFALTFGPAFVASTWFHVHEVPLNERLDYYFGALSGSFMAASTVIRVLGVRRLALQALVYLPFAAADARFLWYQSHRARLDYGWAVQFGGSWLVLHVVLATAWALWRLARRGERRVLYELGSVASVLAFVGFEVVDFVPLWGHLDAHSLWHCGGIFIGLFHAQWLLADFCAFAEERASHRAKQASKKD